MLNINYVLRDLFQRNFLRHIISIFLLIGLCMTYQKVEAIPYQKVEAIPYQKVDARPALQSTVFKNIQIDELLLTVIDEFKKVGFNYKENRRYAHAYGVRLEIDFNYLPKITNDDGGDFAKLVISMIYQENDVVVYHVHRQGIAFSETLVLKNEADIASRQKAFENFELGCININERLKKFLVPSTNK